MKTIHIKKVLIALDYDPTAQKVAEAGYSLARSMEAEVVLLHVVSDPVYYTSPEYSPITGLSGYIDTSQMLLDATDGLQNASQHFLDKTKHHLNDDSIQTRVAVGDVAESILETANDMHVELIVLGSHSHKWLENIVMGSVAKDVLNDSRIPLFIIPTKKRG